MDFTATEDALAEWVRALMGLTADDAIAWEDRQRPWFQGRIVLLSWVAGAGVGVDEVRWEQRLVGDPPAPPVAPAPNLEPVIVGCRTVTLQISAEVHNQLPGAPHARALIERLRNRLSRPSSLATLAGLNLGLIGADGVVSANYEVDDHVVGRALLSVRFNATSFDRDTDGAVGSLESVEVTSHVQNPAGAEVAPALQMVNEVIP